VGRHTYSLGWPQFVDDAILSARAFVAAHLSIINERFCRRSFIHRDFVGEHLSVSILSVNRFKQSKRG
jgi:hypothetical protein